MESPGPTRHTTFDDGRQDSALMPRNASIVSSRICIVAKPVTEDNVGSRELKDQMV